MRRTTFAPHGFNIRDFTGLHFLMYTSTNPHPINANKTVELYIDDLRLGFENGSTLILDSFETLADIQAWNSSLAWHGFPRGVQPVITATDDSAAGKSAMKVSIPVFKKGWAFANITRPDNMAVGLPGILDVREVTTLGFSWKLALDGEFVGLNSSALFAVNAAPFTESQPFPNFPRSWGVTNFDYNARQGVGGGAG